MENLNQASSVSFVIPWIDWGMAPINPNKIASEQRKQLDRLVNAPSTIWWWALLWKIGIGLVVWALMAVVYFTLAWILGTLMWWSWEVTSSWLGFIATENQFSWIVNLILWFVIAFGWNLVLMVIYTFLFSWKYSDIGKTVGLLLLTNGILAIGIAVVFLMFKDLPNASIVVFVLYVCLATFVSSCQIEFVVNPNYSASSLMGCCLWFCISIMALSWMLAPSLQSNVNTDWAKTLMLLTPLLSFPLMILWQGIWDIVYGKIYENWANPFYLPSRAELDTETLLEQENQELEHEEVTVNI